MIAKSLTPGQISISPNDAIGCSTLEGLLGVKGWVNAAEDDKGASFLGKATECIPPESVPGMNTDAYHIAGVDRIRIERFDSFVTQDWISKLVRSGCS